MYDWSKLKNFRLAKGSHDDPTGGVVCLVEAALLHSGFRYKAIRTAYDAPACFSWIIAHYAISLNDQMPDDLRQELLLPFIGGVFVLEALSVILQVGSYKLRKKRIFKMAPIHHHFELLGWSESKVIVRFWIASLIFALFALTTLKLR